ncbi:hypothetical protein EK904_002442 [Melospiza melodia maxima]|nr:hypothetical protein EK904_002442 [Melospiza melodia maxima]
MKEKEAALCLEFLLQNDANPSIQDKEGYNTVHYAAAYGHRQCLELVSACLGASLSAGRECACARMGSSPHGHYWSSLDSKKSVETCDMGSKLKYLHPEVS